MIIVWLVIFIVILNIYPVIRFGYKRLIFLKKIKSACKTYGYELSVGTKSPFWFFSDKKGSMYDFAVRSKEKVWKVKLFGAYSKRSSFTFEDKGRLVVKDHLMLFSWIGVSVRLDLDIKYYDMKQVNFKSGERTEDYFRQEIPVLLLHPVPADINIGNGDRTELFSVYSLSGLIDVLKYEYESEAISH